ncbi:MAG: S1 RNA-binding domain-containing protein [Thermotogae bacterium]|nr:S1 RNA-binding domain-containing protein [Thermotogota bacterium]
MSNEEFKEFEEYLNKFEGITIQRGKKVQGTVVAKQEDGILVDLLSKQEGFIPLEELLKPIERYRVGDTVEGVIVGFRRMGEEEERLVVISEKLPRLREELDRIETAYRNEEIISGRIVEKVQGGYKVKIGDLVEAFLPGSHAMLQYSHRFPARSLDFLIIDFRRRGRNYNVVVSRKEVEEREIRKFFESHKVGDVVEGIVEAVKDFGAFIKLTDKITGLVPRSEISWETNPNPRDHFKRRQKVKLKIISLDEEQRKVTLSLKAMIPDPWENVEEKYKEGEKYTGTVTSIMPFGFFVQLEPGVEGLVHISEVFWGNTRKDLKEVVKVGDVVEVLVLGVNKAERKISLSYRKAKGDPWETIDERYPVGSVHEGTVVKVLPTGTIVEIEDGISGLVHLGEISWGYVEDPSSLVKEGDRVKVKILSMDKENRRLRFSIRQAEENPWKKIARELKIGDIVSATIRKVINSGIIVELDDYKVEAFVPAAHASREIVKNLHSIYKPGDKVEAVILKLTSDISANRRNMILSVRELELAKEKLEYQKMKEKELSEAKVTLGDLLKEKIGNDNSGAGG